MKLLKAGASAAMLGALALFLSANAAHAGPIAPGSVLNLTGVDTFTATDVNFNGTVSVPVAGVTNSFAILGGGTVTNGANPFVYSPYTADSEIFTVTEGGNVGTFDIKSVNVLPSSAGFLDLSGTATVSLTGFDSNELATWEFGTQAGSTTPGSFSATIEAVPEPGPLAILSVGLIGLAFTKRRN